MTGVCWSILLLIIVEENSDHGLVLVEVFSQFAFLAEASLYIAQSPAENMDQSYQTSPPLSSNAQCGWKGGNTVLQVN